MTNKNNHHSQAIEIAVDAHASRLIREHSPEEAFVDYSSLGPYVTESLRTNANATNDLIELLEGQCQMTRDTASMVIANIDRAVRTGDVLVAGDDTNSTNKSNGPRGTISSGGGSGSDDMSSGSSDTRRTRSKSLGSEPLAYDVSFLGKILHDAMVMPTGHSSSAPAEVDLSAAFATAAPTDISVTNEHNSIMSSSAVEDMNIGILRAPNSLDIDPLSSASFAVDNNPNKARNKQRSVTFDETQSSTSFLWYNTASSPAVGPIVMKEDDDVQFNPLGGILDVLGLEEEGGQQQLQQQQTHFSVMESILETSFATVDSTKSDGLNNEEENEKTIMAPIASTVLGMQGGVNHDSLLLPQCQLILDPKEKEAQASSSPPSSSSPSSDFPTLGEASDTKSLSQKQNGTTGKGRKSKKKKEANDLAAALFRPSRSRSNSLLDNSNQRPRALSLASSSMLRPSSADSPLFPAPSSGNGGVGMGSLLSQSLENAAAAAATGNANIATSPSSENNTAASSPSAMTEMISTTQLLLTLNSHLGTEAATLASQLTDGDLNLAQYLIEAARSDSSSDARANTANTSNRRSRICRHELRGTCYRSDCPYSHDLGGVTCLFWLRGRCRGESCRFMHGFAESLLDGISEEYLNEKREQDAKKKEEEGKKIQTGNLLQHNQNQWTGASAGKNLSKSLPTQGFLFLSPSQGGTDSSMTTVW
eukprot:CAMPEP_0113380382 /NCGR_PEP_ID=MMETSP0013_2-20120614/4729_1 /TAXON_ID=2843 ORGANISM="Skeletonema costatum, Strain 1716" /NCGR_SAMPLE_ID=MMETSP0013_2 /ASSEMBLY_ACC=CAM_ASM_000158 /LENGTH=704 /DNA_ID=CAMNT_0000262719 /DNA_START=134 /DNA_END=2245 /DNA_ORIENTATION=+ /assembly_acc=CAM_ASM_000158